MKRRAFLMLMLAVLAVFPLTVTARPDPPIPPIPPTVPPGIVVPSQAPGRQVSPTPGNPITAPIRRPIAPTAPGVPAKEPTVRQSPRALFFGDSISDPAFGYGQFADALCGSEGWTRVNQSKTYGMPNAAIGGGTLQVIPNNPNVVPYPAVDTFHERVGTYVPDELVIFFGTNDYGWSSNEVTPATYRAAWESLYVRIAALPVHPHVIVIGLPLIDWEPYYFWNQFPAPLSPPQAPGFGTWATSIPDATARLDAVSADEALQHGATWVPLVPGMTEAMFDRPNIHPNALGMQYIWQRVHAALH